jgi:hypothetical protein
MTNLARAAASTLCRPADASRGSTGLYKTRWVDRMNEEAIRAAVAALDTRRSSEEELAWGRLSGLGADVVPFLAEAYPRFRRWEGRASLLYHSTRHARTSDAAFELAVAALGDRSFVVRNCACAVLAYSLRREALLLLREQANHPDARTREDVAAALDAIEKQNHHYFRDRDHSGMVKWIVNKSDRESG